MIWGAFRRTYICELIATAIAAFAIVGLSAVGLDAAAIPAGVLFEFGVFVSLAAYRQRYGRL